MARPRGVLRRRRRRLAAAWLLAVLVATGAGCSDDSGGDSGSDSGGDSGSGTSSAESWADDLCSSVGTWTASIDSARTTLSHPRDLSANELETTVEDVRKSTETLIDDLGKMGKPDTEAGDAAASRLRALSDQLKSQEAVVEEAAGTEPDSMQQRLARVSTITGAAATMVSDTKAALSDLRDLDGAQELQDAFAEAGSCQDLDG